MSGKSLEDILKDLDTDSSENGSEITLNIQTISEQYEERGKDDRKKK